MTGNKELAESELFFNLFYLLALYDDTDGDHISPYKTAISLIILCSGDVVHKIEALFEKLSKNMTLSLEYICFFIVSSLFPLFLLTKKYYLEELIDIFNAMENNFLANYQSKKPVHQNISYNDFIDYYRTYSTKYIQWIDLLDLSNCSDSNDNILLDIQLYDDSILSITSKEYLKHERLCREIARVSLSLDDCYECFDEYVTSSYIDYNSYIKVVSEIFLKNVNRNDIEWYIHIFKNIYNYYDSFDTGSIIFSDFFLGFSIFLQGKKSEKLKFAFQLLDINSDNKLNRKEFWHLLKGYFTIITALKYDKFTQEYLYAVEQQCTFLVCNIFAFFGKSLEFIDIEKFSYWYNNNGYKEIPWIELLDPSKWYSLHRAQRKKYF